MTYEGSTTHPGCWETTVWIIINKPVYITKQEMYALRKLMQGSQEIPKAPLGNNARPLQPLHHRTVRTNIDFQNTDNSLGKSCPVSMKKEMYYKGNPLLGNNNMNYHQDLVSLPSKVIAQHFLRFSASESVEKHARHSVPVVIGVSESCTSRAVQDKPRRRV
ncbi:hypothetical protein J6590_069870 [Homalodisca vitripennis]|nr:hypothetical protein J6590_069870 [Homalodisca vitripennis]